MKTRRILIARPHGFCAGVWRALDIIAAAERLHPPPLYCLNELVHNRRVVDDLIRRGVRFVRRLEEVPCGATVLFSAHGVAPAVRAQAAARHLVAVDATCPFVNKVHADVQRYAREGYTVVVIGSRDHDEVVGVAGEAPESVVVIEGPAAAEGLQPPDPHKVAVVTQTTLSLEQVATVMTVLKARFPDLCTPPQHGICYATTNRQEAVRRVARESDLVVVLGSRNSANSNRLVEVAQNEDTRAVLVAALQELAEVDLNGVQTVGLTAGASTPQQTVDETVAFLRSRGFEQVDELTVADETMAFPLPAALRHPHAPCENVHESRLAHEKQSAI